MSNLTKNHFAGILVCLVLICGAGMLIFGNPEVQELGRHAFFGTIVITSLAFWTSSVRESQLKKEKG